MRVFSMLFDLFGLASRTGQGCLATDKVSEGLGKSDNIQEEKVWLLTATTIHMLDSTTRRTKCFPFPNTLPCFSHL